MALISDYGFVIVEAIGSGRTRVVVSDEPAAGGRPVAVVAEYVVPTSAVCTDAAVELVGEAAVSSTARVSVELGEDKVLRVRPLGADYRRNPLGLGGEPVRADLAELSASFRG